MSRWSGPARSRGRLLLFLVLAVVGLGWAVPLAGAAPFCEVPRTHAKLVLDGRKVNLFGELPHDAFLNPTVFEDVTSEMMIAREEIFGPVASVLRARNFDDVVEMIHKSPFGNAASIFTSSGKLAREFQYKVQCGNIGINVGIVAPMAFFPFSGMRDSFFGTLHGQGTEAIRFFTESKVVIQRWF